MSEDDKPEKPDPIEDVRKAFGLLFRAAKSAIDQLPTHHFEETVVAGAREVGRAIENVTSSLDKQFFKRDADKAERPVGPHPAEPPASAEPPIDASGAPHAAAGPDPKREVRPEEAPPEEAPKGPRVG
jgi:hypothetical protein